MSLSAGVASGMVAVARSSTKRIQRERATRTVCLMNSPDAFWPSIACYCCIGGWRRAQASEQIFRHLLWHRSKRRPHLLPPRVHLGARLPEGSLRVRGFSGRCLRVRSPRAATRVNPSDSTRLHSRPSRAPPRPRRQGSKLSFQRLAGWRSCEFGRLQQRRPVLVARARARARQPAPLA